jgi:hypothetical protein
MALFMYIKKTTEEWWCYEIRTYDGTGVDTSTTMSSFINPSRQE